VSVRTRRLTSELQGRLAKCAAVAPDVAETKGRRSSARLMIHTKTRLEDGRAQRARPCVAAAPDAAASPDASSERIAS
jgi:hypothetical protein